MLLAVAVTVIVLIVVAVAVLSIHRRHLVINKYLIILIAVAVGVIFYTQQFQQNTPDIEIPIYQEKAPSIQAAPYVLQTPSRAYYINKFEMQGDYLVLTDYYSYDKKKWRESDAPLYLDTTITGYKNLQVQSR